MIGQTNMGIVRKRNRRIAVVALLCSLIASSAGAADLAGDWRGGWKSCRTGHRGRLSAKFCRTDACHVQATFRGTFALVIPFRYRATLPVVDEQPGYLRMSGSKRLGPLMGSFAYDATVSGDQFNATYRSRRDHGVWNLSR